MSSNGEARSNALNELLTRSSDIWRAASKAANMTPSAPRWQSEQLRGRLVELSSFGASACVSAAMILILQVQELGEAVVWISPRSRSYYPPDAARMGIDISALLTAFASDGKTAATIADRLLRSGAFGLVVLDLGRDDQIPIALQGRLVSLAQRHQSIALCLTEKSPGAASIGSMVSLRAEVTRRHIGFNQFECTIQATKDKQRGPGWTDCEVLRGPDGMY